MTSKLGLHWLREHPDNNRDLAHVERMQYKSIKLFKNAWDNPGFCRDLLTVLSRDCYILARDHALSEEKDFMAREPVKAGETHADQWIQKVREKVYALPIDRTFFLGINEPDADSGDRAAIDRYTTAFLERLRSNGLRGGAFNFSTGHPRTVDGTTDTLADYTVFEQSHQAIVRGHHIGVLHIYGTGAVPCAPGHYDRLKACAWQDVEWVVGEFAVDEHVIGGGPHDGFHKFFNGRLNDYCEWLDTAIIGINDPRIHSYQVFTYDYSHPWDSFDTRPIRDALESYNWRHMQVQPTPQPTTPPVTVHIPSVIGEGPTPITQPEPPMPTNIIDPRVAQAILAIESGGRSHGLDGRVIIRFESHIFKTSLGNDAIYNKHFRHGSPVWTGQQVRWAENEAWRDIHTGKQDDEYAAFSLALQLNAEAAYRSISMGAAQIMGFNAKRIGYPNAKAMFDSFKDAQMQTIGFINFCLSDGLLMTAIRNKDWRSIARFYNGSGQVELYSGLLRKAYEELGG